MAQTLVNIRMDEELKKIWSRFVRTWNEYDNGNYYICKENDKGKKDSF